MMNSTPSSLAAVVQQTLAPVLVKHVAIIVCTRLSVAREGAVPLETVLDDARTF